MADVPAVTRRPEITWEVFQRICAELARTGAKHASCQALGFTNGGVLGAINRAADREDYAWQQLWDDSYQQFKDSLLVEAKRRAVDGVDEPVFGRVDKDEDGEIGTVRKYSDSLLQTLLKGHHRDLLGDKLDVKGPTPALDVLSELTPAAKRKVRDIIAQDLREQAERRQQHAVDAEFTDVAAIPPLDQA